MHDRDYEPARRVLEIVMVSSHAHQHPSKFFGQFDQLPTCVSLGHESSCNPIVPCRWHCYSSQISPDAVAFRGTGNCYETYRESVHQPLTLRPRGAFVAPYSNPASFSSSSNRDSVRMWIVCAARRPSRSKMKLFGTSSTLNAVFTFRSGSSAIGKL